MEEASLTLASLPREVKRVVIKDEGKGANWARNEGFKQVDTEFVLFSDNDINWYEGSIELLLQTLEDHPEASYAYGAYMLGDAILCNMDFDASVLKLFNYISTMSLIRTKDFPGFDENIKRFQDWDLWLTMLEEGKTGVYCGKVIFDTPIRDGITYNNPFGPYEALEVIRDKHKL